MIEADYLMRRRRADSIRARAISEGPSKGRIYVSNRILPSSIDSLAPRLGPHIYVITSNSGIESEGNIAL